MRYAVRLTESTDPLHWREFALFPVDPKSQLAEVTEHHVPVLAQLIPRLNEPIVEIFENANAVFSHGNKGRLRKSECRSDITNPFGSQKLKSV